MNEKKYSLRLIGSPVGHSRSPLIHSTLGEITGLNIEYSLCEVKPENVGAFVEEAKQLGLDGFNVTVPDKTEVIKHLAYVDENAKFIGAVNTCVRREDGYYGYNTDIYGLDQVIMREGVDIKGKKCVVLGAGGAARSAIALFIKKQAGQIVIVNRNREHADVLIKEFREKVEKSAIPVYKTAEQLIDEKEEMIVVQATSLGLKETDSAPVEGEGFYELCEFGYDLVPGVHETAFIRKLKAAGKKCSDGMGMLIYQAVRGFELWTGRAITDAEIALLRQKTGL